MACVVLPLPGALLAAWMRSRHGGWSRVGHEPRECQRVASPGVAAEPATFCRSQLATLDCELVAGEGSEGLRVVKLEWNVVWHWPAGIVCLGRLAIELDKRHNIQAGRNSGAIPTSPRHGGRTIAR